MTRATFKQLSNIRTRPISRPSRSRPCEADFVHCTLTAQAIGGSGVEFCGCSVSALYAGCAVPLIRQTVVSPDRTHRTFRTLIHVTWPVTIVANVTLCREKKTTTSHHRLRTVTFCGSNFFLILRAWQACLDPMQNCYRRLSGLTDFHILGKTHVRKAIREKGHSSSGWEDCYSIATLEWYFFQTFNCVKTNCMFSRSKLNLSISNLDQNTTFLLWAN